MQHITTGTFRVFTFKDGLLSRVAHDLQLTLSRFEIAVEGEAVTGTFWPGSLRVDGPVSGGRLEPEGLRDKDRAEIQGTIADKILQIGRHPTAQFTGTHRGDAVNGTLALAGRSAPVSLTARAADGRIRGEVELVPTRWGIAPYKALLGAIKLQDRVRVVFDLPWT